MRVEILLFSGDYLGKKCRYWEYLGVLEKMIILEVWNGVGRGEDGVEGGGGGYEGQKTQRFRAKLKKVTGKGSTW